MRLRMYATKYDKYDTDDHITEIIRVYLVLSFLSASPGRSLEQIPLLTAFFYVRTRPVEPPAFSRKRKYLSTARAIFKFYY